MVTAQQVDKPPIDGWNPQGALSLPEAWSIVAKYRPSDLPMPVAMFVTIFFEETAICNMVQQGKPIGIGPGQLQVSEHGKVVFFASPHSNQDNFMGGHYDSSNTVMAVDQNTQHVFWRGFSLFPKKKYPHLNLTLLTQDRILKDNDFSIKMHVMYLYWLTLGYGDGKHKTLGGLLTAQTGVTNVKAQPLFMKATAALEKLMQPDPNTSLSWSNAEWKAYYARRRNEFKQALNIARQFKDNQVPEGPEYDKFWEFLLPDEFLRNPMRRMRDMLFE